MRVVVGLGNPGPEYDGTRHNVGWWLADRMAYDWDFGAFEKVGRALRVDGSVAGQSVRILKPTTYMNRSGSALTGLRRLEEFEVGQDLLVVVDDAAIEVGRARFRPGGGSGGHKGLKSVSGVLGTEGYARLRIGVGSPPQEVDLTDWVLSPMPPDDEEVVVGLLPELSEGVKLWVGEGIEAAMNRFNR